MICHWSILTLRDMQSAILRSTHSLGPDNLASAKRSLVIALITRLLSRKVSTQETWRWVNTHIHMHENVNVCEVSQSYTVMVQWAWLNAMSFLWTAHCGPALWLKLQKMWIAPEQVLRAEMMSSPFSTVWLCFLLCFSSFLFVFFASSLFSQFRCFRKTFLCQDILSMLQV